MLTPRACPHPNVIRYAIHDLHSSRSHLSLGAQAGLGAEEEKSMRSCFPLRPWGVPQARDMGGCCIGKQGQPSPTCLWSPCAVRSCQLPWRVGGCEEGNLVTGAGALRARREGLGGFRGAGT